MVDSEVYKMWWSLVGCVLKEEREERNVRLPETPQFQVLTLGRRTSHPETE